MESEYRKLHGHKVNQLFERSGSQWVNQSVDQSKFIDCAAITQAAIVEATKKCEKAMLEEIFVKSHNK